jgi:prepilin-type N-terminal cleavage/methylation domain-containing protein
MQRQTLKSTLRRPRRPSHGFTLLEVTVAAAVLVVLASMCVQVYGAMAVQRRSLARRALAVQTVQNHLEHIDSLPWDEVSDETASAITLPEHLLTQLPGANIAADVTTEAGPVASKRVSIELSWTGHNGQPARPVRLMLWVFPSDRADL